MAKNSYPIGVFDSGVGGLTVLRSLMDFLPKEKFIYVGDTARVPYGTKSHESVKRFSWEITRFLKQKKVKMIVVACNTASALALNELKSQLDLPVVGVIEPGARAAVGATSRGKIGVIGTEATVHSRAYEKAIHRKAPSLKVYSYTCPLFVPLVEEGWENHPISYRVASIYLKPLLKKRIDALVLGCTHYPLLKKVLSRVAKKVQLIDSAEETAKAVKSLLTDKKLLSNKKHNAHEFFSSDDPKKFSKIGSLFLGKRISQAKRIRLEGK